MTARVLLTAAAALACTCLPAAAAEDPPARRSDDRSCSAIDASSGTARPRVVTRRVAPPEGAVDLRILGEPGAPAILSLIGADPDRYSDYTYNGAHADLDVSDGGLNLRPLDGFSSVNIWSMLGNTRLRVGSRDFREALDVWHSGANVYIRSTVGSVIVQSPLETRAAAVLAGDTLISGTLRLLPAAPTSSSSACTEGQIMADSEFIYVCTGANAWKRAALAAWCIAFNCYCLVFL